MLQNPKLETLSTDLAPQWKIPQLTSCDELQSKPGCIKNNVSNYFKPI
jgi:hypothetical protein